MSHLPPQRQAQWPQARGRDAIAIGVNRLLAICIGCARAAAGAIWEFSAAALAPSTVLGEGRASFLKGLAGDTGKAKRTNDISECRCCQLALRYRLSLSEVKRIVKEFESAPKTTDGLIQRNGFNKVMCRIFDVDVVDDNVDEVPTTDGGRRGGQGRG